ncbi:MAG: cysteine-rich CWC family protein [Gammaproteobacteria bacterium]
MIIFIKDRIDLQEPECEIKTCPHCLQVFKCGWHDVTSCQCGCVNLDQCYRDYISNKYDDCLCVKCLEQLCREYDANMLSQKTK